MPASEVPRPAPPRSRRHALISALAVLLLAALVGLSWYLTQREPAPGPGAGPGAAGGGGARGGRGGRGAPSTTVGVAVAEQADVPITVEALGTVSPVASVTLRPQVSGVLREVLFKEGEKVRAGQLLARIDPRAFELALQQASGQRQRDAAQLENARLTLQRYRTLLQQDSIARQDVDTQAALVRQLEGTVATSRATESSARLNLGYSRVVAPIAGRVGLRVVDRGNVVNPGDAGGIVRITQTAPIDVEFSLPQDRVPEVQARVAAGARLAVTALDRSRATVLDSGRFLTLDNQIDVQTGTVRAKARFANARETLFPNQFVNVRLLLQTLEGAVVVPVAALRSGSQGDYVYVLDEAARTVALRPVKRGPATDTRVVVASGLQPGEKVITEGADRLKDGARVALPGDTPASGAGGRRRRGEPGGGAAAGPAADDRRGEGATASAPAAGASNAVPGGSRLPDAERQSRRAARAAAAAEGDASASPIGASSPAFGRGGLSDAERQSRRAARAAAVDDAEAPTPPQAASAPRRRRASDAAAQ